MKICGQGFGAAARVVERAAIDSQCAGANSAGVINRERAGVHCGRARVEIRSREGQCAAAVFGDPTRCCDGSSGKGQCRCAIGDIDRGVGPSGEREVAICRTISSSVKERAVSKHQIRCGRAGTADIARISAVGYGADAQCSAVERCRAGIGIIGIQHECAGAVLRETSCARDGCRAEVCSLRDGVGAIEGKRAVIHNRAVGRERPGCASIAELQGSRVDPRQACVGICCGENNPACAVLGQVAGASDACCAELCALRNRIGAVEDQRAVGSDIDRAAR